MAAAAIGGRHREVKSAGRSSVLPRLPGGGGGAAFLDPSHRPDRKLVEAEQGKSEADLGEGIGRRKDGSDHEDADDGEFPARAQLFGAQDADLTQKREDDGELKTNAESQNQRQDQTQI